MAEQLPKGVRRRGGVLWVSVSTGGRRLRRSGGRTLEEALRVRAELFIELGLACPSPSASTEPIAPVPADPTVAELADRYLQNLRVTAKPSAVARLRRALSGTFGTTSANGRDPPSPARISPRTKLLGLSTSGARL